MHICARLESVITVALKKSYILWKHFPVMGMEDAHAIYIRIGYQLVASLASGLNILI